MNKRFGQNFLINPGARRKLLEILNRKPGESVWEIGPGIGAMTAMLCETPGAVTVFEIDRGFCRILEEQFSHVPEWTLVEGDFLKTWEERKDSSGFPRCILGNLPYNVGSVIIGELMKTPGLTSRMVFTLQKEVVQRMTARPGTRDYSGFSAVCQFVCDVTGYGDLHARSFYPAPNVTSSVVGLVPHFRYAGIRSELFFDLVNDMFSSRRKTLRNNLYGGRLAGRLSREVLASCLEEAGIQESRRGEELDFSEMIRLAEVLTGRAG